LIDNEFHGNTTTRYAVADYTTSRVTDLEWQSYTPTISAATPGAFAASITSAKYRLQGNTVFVRGDVTVTNAGTGTAYVSVTLPTNFSAGTNTGMIVGQEKVNTGYSLVASANAGTLLLVYYNNTFPGALNSRLVFEGEYSLT
jgi:hypothetical protein